MDLKFSKAKRELIKEIEISDDASLIERYLAEMRARREQDILLKVLPISKEEYRRGMLESIECVQRGEVYSMEEVDKLFGLDEEE